MVSRYVSNDVWINSNADRLNRAVQRRLPKSPFAVLSVPSAQSRRAQLLRDSTFVLHETWDGLDTGRRSAACLFEWARLQIFLAAEVLPLLEATKDKIYHITLADKRWRHNLEALNGDVFNAPRRKVRASIKKLREVGLTPVFVAQYEISGSCGLRDDYLLEPHVHVIMGGASKSELKAAFKVRLPKAQRGRDKPVRVTRVKHSQLGNLLGYISKMKAQDRVEYRRDDGRHGRTTNRMPPDHELGWLRCMASVSIAHLIQFGGFAVPITSRFTHCEMATLVGEL